MNPNELSERLWDFAARVGKLVDALPDTRLGRHVAGQLLRCGTAPAPNYDEASVTTASDAFLERSNMSAAKPVIAMSARCSISLVRSTCGNCPRVCLPWVTLQL